MYFVQILIYISIFVAQLSFVYRIRESKILKILIFLKQSVKDLKIDIIYRFCIRNKKSYQICFKIYVVFFLKLKYRL